VLARIALGAAALVASDGCGASGAPTDITIRVYPDGIPSFFGETRNAPLVAFNPNGLIASTRGARGERPGTTEWLALTGTDGVYHAIATGSHYIVAVGCQAYEPARSLGGLRLYYETVNDNIDLAVSGCQADQETVPVTVELADVPRGAITDVWLGSAIMPGESPKGVFDVFATTHTYDRVAAEDIPLRGYRAPESIEISGPSSLKIDYGALALPYETHRVSVDGFDPADGVSVWSTYATPHSRRQWPLVTDNAEFFRSESERTYATLDPSMRQPDDVSNLRVHTRSLSGERMYDRYVRLAMKDPVDQSVALPPKLLVDPPVVDSLANRTATVRLPNPPPVLDMVDYTVTLYTVVQGDADQPYSHWLALYVQSGWTDDGSSIVITTPDLSGLPGWTTDMALQPGIYVGWWMRREDRTLPRDTLPVDGRKILHSQVEAIEVSPGI